MRLEENKDKSDKKYIITLKNGASIELTKQDIIDNNLYKLTDKIPDLKIADKLSEDNLFKKILETFESGVQNKFLYYKILSLAFFCYLWAIQISALIQHDKNTISMLFITVWGTFAIIRLNTKPLFKTLTLRTLIKKSDYSFFTSSITYFLIALSILFSFLNKDKLCTILTWENVAEVITLNTFSYLPYLLITSFFISILIAIYNIQEFYERYVLMSELKKSSISIILFGLSIYLVFAIYFPLIVSDLLCSNKGVILFFIALSILAFGLTCSVLLQIFCLFYIFVKKIALYINKIY